MVQQQGSSPGAKLRELIHRQDRVLAVLHTPSAAANCCRPKRCAYPDFIDMARLSKRLDHIWMCWHGPSSRRIFSSETIFVGRQSIVCKLASGPVSYTHLTLPTKRIV